MAFSGGTVRVQINGAWTSLVYNSASGAWEAEITAPGKTSYNEENGVYVVTAEATNAAGTTGTSTANLIVKETIKPIITISSPSSGAYVANNQQPIVFTITDEENGSGVDISSLIVMMDGVQLISGIVTTAIANGYAVTVTPATMTDGSHTVTVQCSDHDGNAADIKSTAFTVDTIPPMLNLTSPVEGCVTNSRTVVVAGSTNDLTSSPVVLTINGNSVSVDSEGAFSTSVTFDADGTHDITVEARDKAGKITTIVRSVTIDTSVPVIKSVLISPNPVNTGEVMTVKVVVE